MYVRASFVIENSVLIPLFTGIIVTLILFGMRWHDELVVDSIKLQVALKLEQENISDKNEKYNEIIAVTINKDSYNEKTPIYQVKNNKLNFDLALRKFITQVQETEVTTRIPQVKYENSQIS